MILLATGAISVTHYLIVGAIMFTAGVVCMAVRRNALGVLMGIELVLNGANINFVAFGSSYLAGEGRPPLGLDGPGSPPTLSSGQVGRTNQHNQQVHRYDFKGQQIATSSLTL